MTDIKELLDAEAARINCLDFTLSDPVQFPRRFDDLRDIEIVSLLCSTIAWGNRTMICRNCEKMLGLMDYQPYAYVMDQGYEDLPDGNVHRTFFNSNLRYYLRGLHQIYSKWGNLQNMVKSSGAADDPMPAWQIADHINQALRSANDGVSDSRCLPQNLNHTALKRLNMALRWLVRNDGIVDMGVWDALKPSQLFIPLDVHVGDVSRELRLLTRKSDDRKAVVELTDALRAMRPDDPVIYDFALFGIGMRL